MVLDWKSVRYLLVLAAERGIIEQSANRVNIIFWRNRLVLFQFVFFSFFQICFFSSSKYLTLISNPICCWQISITPSSPLGHIMVAADDQKYPFVIGKKYFSLSPKYFPWVLLLPPGQDNGRPYSGKGQTANTLFGTDLTLITTAALLPCFCISVHFSPDLWLNTLS